MPTQPTPETSAVRDAAHLIAAAEEILELAPDPIEVATYIGTVADAAKALRANHLADVLEHVRYRAGRITERGTLLVSEEGFTVDQTVYVQDGELRDVLVSTSEALARTGWDNHLPAVAGQPWWDALCDIHDTLGWDAPDPSRFGQDLDTIEETPEPDPDALAARVHGKPNP